MILTGDLTTPTLENHSSKTIILAHVFQVHQSGKKQSAGAFMIPEPDGGGGGLKPGGSMVLMKGQKELGSRPGLTDSPAISTDLVTVIFADGEVLGTPDPEYEGGLQTEFTAMINAGSLAKEENWAELQKLHDLLGTDADGTPGAYGRIAA